ncbi:MAG: response regulator [Chloroflexi bacterium]|nr:response regulator [Chloroflexota bacterium]
MGRLSNVNIVDSEPKQQTDSASGVSHLKLMKKPFSGSEAGANGRGKSILIIDDESCVRTLLEHMFVLEGYQTTIAEDGNEGVASFREIRHDLVFTDLHLPGMSGTEVARSIKAISPNTPVIAVTGWGAALSDADMSQMSFDFIVSKPFELEQLLEMASSLTSRG